MAIRLTVGELAKISGISKQMLIFYDREGIFSPRERGENGYRYYTAEQLEILDSILILRELGVPLKKIRLHMENPSPLGTVNLLQRQEQQLDEKLRRFSMLKQQITHKLDTLRQPIQLGVPTVVTLKEEYLLTQAVERGKTLLDLDICLKQLLKTARSRADLLSFQIGSMGLYSNIAQNIFDQYEYGFLPLAGPGPDVMHKPAGRYACIFWKGDYRNLAQGYHHLIAAVQGQGYEPYGYVYEYSVLDSLTSPLPGEYVTQIQIPLHSCKDRP